MFLEKMPVISSRRRPRPPGSQALHQVRVLRGSPSDGKHRAPGRELKAHTAAQGSACGMDPRHVPVKAEDPGAPSSDKLTQGLAPKSRAVMGPGWWWLMVPIPLEVTCLAPKVGECLAKGWRETHPWF